MLWIGDENRRCRSCRGVLSLVGFKVGWKQNGRDWRKWTLNITCACGKTVGVVAKANMPDDPNLIPPRPDLTRQKEMAFDTRGESPQSLRYLSENAAK